MEIERRGPRNDDVMDVIGPISRVTRSACRENTRNEKSIRYVMGSWRDAFSGPEMHPGHEPSSSRESPSDRGDPVGFRCCFTALKGQHTLAWGNAPGKPDHEDQSPERANHGRMLDRPPGIRPAAHTVRPVCRTNENWAPLQGSGSTRCLPGALPQANLCCPVGAKSTAWQPLFHINNLRYEFMERSTSDCGNRACFLRTRSTGLPRPTPKSCASLIEDRAARASQ